MIEGFMSTPKDCSLAIVRMVLGIIFFAHGAQKMLGWYGGPGLAKSMRTLTEYLHLPAVLAFLVIAGEFFSGIGLVLGFFSRLAALVIGLTMLGAVALVHLRYGLFLNWFGDKEGHGIEYHLLVIALAMLVVLKGAGAFSLDRLLDEQISGSHQQHVSRRTPTGHNAVCRNNFRRST
jgi:putative oxidoreductase